MDVSAIPALAAELMRDYPFLSENHANRLAHAYGTRASKILGTAESMGDLGQSFGASLTEAEVKYLMAYEWARTADDIVWRRSKLGLRLTPQEITALDLWIAAQQISSKTRLTGAGGRP
jgi:glycerol-3-phosphate dehydrogenase